MEFEFSAEVFEWRGPAPFHFVRVPDDVAEDIRLVVAQVTYGWGMVPVSGRIGQTTFTTSLWHREGGYVVPLKDAVRRAEGIELDDVITVWLRLGRE
ncbi:MULTISPECIES: DUF1905 domain-containing protein [unclassified Luteococcus]|uniref:DUF1905 domain-containing protein n=1 Tax=unclassified Luteococcus TaxID=2639923 RepID=UPI00313F2FDF